MGVGDGNGWVRCRCGHRHWGRHGAAGLLLARRNGETVEVLLQLRADWTHHGGTWGLPGGAADSHEEVSESALREAWEETGVHPDAVEVLGTWVSTDHGDWRYTVVIGAPRGPVEPHAANAETTEVRWVDPAQAQALPLHPGLAATWPDLTAALRDLAA